MLKRFCKSNLTQLLLFLVVFGAISVHYKFEVLWDWANYHFYNPWAFFNDRWGYDIAPAGINTFFNPLADIPLYLMVKVWNDFPDLIIFVQGFWAGAVAFVSLKIIRLFFSENNWKDYSLSTLALAFGVTSWPFFIQIGTSTNEMAVSLLVLISWWLILREIKNNANMMLRGRVFLIAGFLLGSAAGLKLTAVTYCISSGVALILCYRLLRPFPKLLGLFVLGGLLGFLLTNGFWMWRLYESFGNPFFPFLNNVFKSEYFEPINYRDETFLPTHIWEYIFYPFYTAFLKIPMDGNFIIAEYRNLFLFMSGGYGLFLILFKKRQQHNYENADIYLWMLCLLNYVIWLSLFSILRYSVPLMLISGIIFVQVGISIYSNKKGIRYIISTSMVIIFGFILLSTPYYSDGWGEREVDVETFSVFSSVWSELQEDKEYLIKYKEKEADKFVVMEDIVLPEGTLLKMYDLPLGGALPLLNRESNVRGILIKTSGFNYEEKFLSQDKWLKKKEEIFSDKNKPLAMLVSLEAKRIYLINTYREYAKQNNLECHWLINNVMNWVLCVPKEDIKSVFRWRYQ